MEIVFSLKIEESGSPALQADSLYCKLCLMGIMITKHQCLLELKTSDVLLAYSKLP